MKSTSGKIHSIETCGTVDGPGIRFVVFLQGCPLRCQYCHNPDTWEISDGTLITPEELFSELIKYKSYIQFSKGGITVTGGEPLLQLSFLKELFTLCKANDIHTVIDTSGFIFNDQVKSLLNITDLVLLDIKNFDPLQYKKITSVSLKPTLDFLEYLGSIHKSTWIRYVLVPNLTDDIASIEALSKHLGSFNNIEKIEVLPFHKMGEYKWLELGIPYALKNTIEPTEKERQLVVDIFKAYNANVSVI